MSLYSLQNYLCTEYVVQQNQGYVYLGFTEPPWCCICALCNKTRLWTFNRYRIILMLYYMEDKF